MDNQQPNPGEICDQIRQSADPEKLAQLFGPADAGDPLTQPLPDVDQTRAKFERAEASLRKLVTLHVVDAGGGAPGCMLRTTIDDASQLGDIYGLAIAALLKDFREALDAVRAKFDDATAAGLITQFRDRLTSGPTPAGLSPAGVLVAAAAPTPTHEPDEREI